MTWLRGTSLLLRVLVALLVIVPVASECHAKPPAKRPYLTPRQRLEAQRLFNAGRLAYRRGDYEEAILKWQESYDISQHPLIFESIANAYERLGDYQKALDALKKWRDEAPRREQAALDARLENLEARLKKAQADAQKKKDAEEARKQREGEAAAKAARDQERAKLLAQKQVEADKNKTIALALIGTGGALVIGGVVMDLIAATSRPDVTSVCREAGDRLYCQDAARDDIELSDTLAIAGDITWIAGSAVAVAGGALLLFGTSVELGEGDAAGEPKADARVLPYATPHGAGLLIGGRF